MKQSSGTLLYRWNDGQLEVLLVHPSGNYNRGKPWSIPKGLPDEGESLEDAARRETIEETGVVAGPLAALGSIQYLKSRKTVHGFAGQAVEGAPRCASWEVDCAEYIAYDRALELIHPDQRDLLLRLREHVMLQGEMPFD
jgi:8-oxo-dGTP pyrophosphatase MutT (NUDIX family)